MDPATASSVAARARTENFPVASLLSPRALRPHLRAIYGFARLVDIVGDEVAGDRLPVLDELAGALQGSYQGEAMAGGVGGRPEGRRRGGPGGGGDGRAPADYPCLLAAARAVPAPDRGQSDGSARDGLRDLGRPEALLRPLRRPGRAAGARRDRPRRRRGGGRAVG